MITTSLTLTPPQLSNTDDTKSLTANVVYLWFGGHNDGVMPFSVIVGGVLSITVMACVAVDVLPAPSVAVQVMVVVPTGNVFPDGERVMVTVPQLSVAVAVPGSTTVSHVVAFGPVYAVIAGGTKVNVGGVVSTTVSVMSLLLVLPAPLLLLEPSLAVMWTVWAPRPTTVPGAGSWVTAT